ncbi:MAG: hypothetical protein J0M24_00390 [Verrucomicrobia bacterium]|jgi:hypothetical protein|nr:hypothetical protein [Verrucomicrobiota bacterium]
MKTTLLSLLGTVALALSALAHGDVQLGPNGGRILELSKNETMHGEVTLVNGVFHVALLDRDMKPVELKEQSLAVTGGDRSNPKKPKVEKQGNHFVFPALQGDEYPLAFQFKESPSAKVVIARMTYDATTCSACKKPEWVCACAAKENEKPSDKKK